MTTTNARGHDLRAVLSFGHDDRYLVWADPAQDVFETTLTTCSCGKPNLWGTCDHREFVRRLADQDIVATDPISAATMETAKVGKRRRRDTPMHRPRDYQRGKGKRQHKIPRGRKGVYRGVVNNYRLKTRPWNAFVYLHGQKTYLGGYQDPETAARAYDWAARHVHGEDARLNFPDDIPLAPPPGIPDSALEAIASLMLEEAS